MTTKSYSLYVSRLVSSRRTQSNGRSLSLLRKLWRDFQFQQFVFGKGLLLCSQGLFAVFLQTIPMGSFTGGEGAWKLVITCWVNLELMYIFPTM